MNMTINRTYRDALYDGLMTDLTAIGDIFSHLHTTSHCAPSGCGGASRSSYARSMTWTGGRSQTARAST
jgi:hypothetical protein